MPSTCRDFRMTNSATTGPYTPPHLYWTKNLAIGHALIDTDHRRIFDIANQLQAEFVEQPEHSIVGEALVELIEHTGDHFLREEALMKAVRYPGVEEHRVEHAALMNQVNELHRSFMEGKANISVEVSEFLHKGLVPHILNTDMALGHYLRNIR